MSMLKYFLEIGCAQTLFDGLDIGNGTVRDFAQSLIGKFTRWKEHLSDEENGIKNRQKHILNHNTKFPQL